MDLATIWFALIGILLIGYAVLDGFDLGAGILHLVVARTDRERRTVIASIAPVWDGNEVWLLTAGGALFAAFPLVYATAFSGFYLALILVLLGLIFRAVSLEVRDAETSTRWRAAWDVVFSLSSIVPALLFGVAIGNVLQGLPLGIDGVYRGGLAGLLRPFPLLCGVLAVAMFTMQGGAWLALRTEGPVRGRARAAASAGATAFGVLWVAITVLALGMPHLRELPFGPVSFVAPTVALLALGGFFWALAARRDGLAFGASSFAIAGLLALVGLSLYPDILPAEDALRSLTVHNAASSDLTLTVMLIVALVGMPLVLAYTAFVYTRFPSRVTLDEAHSY